MSKPTKTLAAATSALFPKSEKAISEALGQEQFNTFAEEAQAVQDRLTAAEDDPAPAAALKEAQDDLTAANATIKETQDKLTASESNLSTANAATDKANNELTAANKLNGELKVKADQWDAQQAALKGSQMGGDSNGGKNTPAAGTRSDKDQANLEEKQRLAKMYPGMMADLGIPAAEE